MHGQVVQPTGWAQVLIPLAVFAVIFAFRMRRMSQTRPLKLEQLWVVPALYLVVVAASFMAKPPTAIGWVASAAGLAVGALVGWWRGTTTAIHVDPETHQLNQKASAAGMLILMALIGTKMVIGAEGRAAHLDALGNGLLAMALGTFAVMRVEMFLRAKRLLGEARAAA